MSLENEECDIDVLLNLLEDGNEHDDLGQTPTSANPQTFAAIDDKRTLDGNIVKEADDEYDSSSNQVSHEDIRNLNQFSPHASNAKVNNKESNNADSLEEELSLMEEKMKKLREEISKKKNLKMNDKSVGFTKPSAVITPSHRGSEGMARELNEEEREKLFTNLANNRSEIHSGDTDSEDEEDKRAPLEANLSSYGHFIRKRIAHSQQKSKNYLGMGALDNQNLSGWKNAKGGSLIPMGKKVSNKPKLEDDDVNAAVDPFSGIRIV